MRLYPDCEDEVPEECPAFMEDACPVMLKEQDKPCDGCRWLKPNPNYQGEMPIGARVRFKSTGDLGEVIFRTSTHLRVAWDGSTRGWGEWPISYFELLEDEPDA